MKNIILTTVTVVAAFVSLLTANAQFGGSGNAHQAIISDTVNLSGGGNGIHGNDRRGQVRQQVVNSDNVPLQQQIIDSQPFDRPGTVRLAYFSRRLGARFVVQKFYLPEFGSFFGARLVSEPEHGSPLRQLGLEQGDVITRLDGTPVTDTDELEKHILDTNVRYIRAGESRVRAATMIVSQFRQFRDPVNFDIVDRGHHHHDHDRTALRP